MRCHYEVLGLSLNTTTEEIKKTYRKLALELHPDKNLHRCEEATEEFRLVQQAYEILIDPQERAWYDKHREQIIRGGLENEYKDNSLDVYQYFNTSCFKGYNDGDKGFYTVYREVFHKITEEDKPFMDDDALEVPQFGYSYSSYESVVHDFYAYWQSYCTSKTFSWVDKFDLVEARKSNVGRHALRLIEKENKKLRDQHKKMRNEEVKQLVAFVRKRDKRVQAHKKLLEEQNAEKARKFQEKRKKQIQERQKSLQNYQESEWSSLSQFEQHFNEIENHLDNMFGKDSDESAGDDSQEETLDLYCAACDKDFRSEKAMQNHEKSKKHKENVQLLKKIMQEAEFGEKNESLETPNSEIEELAVNSASEKEDNIEELVESKSSKKRKKKQKKKNIITDEYDLIPDVTDITEELSDAKLNSEHAEVDHISDNDHLCQISSVDQSAVVHNPEVTVNEITKEKEPDDSNKQSSTKKKREPKKKNNPTNVPQETEQLPNLCVKCGSIFGSRNKLFDHLKTSGHAVYIGENNVTNPVKGASKKTVKNKSAKGKNFQKANS